MNTVKEINKDTIEPLQNMTTKQYNLLITKMWNDLLDCALVSHDNKKFRNIEKSFYFMLDNATDKQYLSTNLMTLNLITYGRLLEVYEDFDNKSGLLNRSLLERNDNNDYGMETVFNLDNEFRIKFVVDEDEKLEEN